ncbi:hypothetical protein [Pelagibacterium sp. H642]|uniref:hypothetical protein n=1 Tax=Pelagibacterium sp. H642 TaxID=1881069 RepID=UPI002814ADED|nr:hypothetical protein [Pelagibacterium sp. H642]WMT92264.1 hypothetical protein NO934_08410 [Pelagibacterium sp. H642]
MAWLSRRDLIAFALVAPFVTAAPVFAHHGWSWTSVEWFELEGALTDIYIGQPHPTLTLDDGTQEWTVELAPVDRTLATGFDETTVAIGDPVTAIGHRALEETDYRMKAVRLVTEAGTFDVYPEFAAEYDQR